MESNSVTFCRSPSFAAVAPPILPAMNSSVRQSCLFILLIALAIPGCSKGVDWSARERENAGFLQASLQATSEAAAIANEIESEADYRIRRDRLLQALRAAHLNAARVEDTVLDKLHPQLYARFRLDYQRALGRMINAYESGELGAAQNAAGDIQGFMDWYREHRHTFRWWEDAMRQ